MVEPISSNYKTLTHVMSFTNNFGAFGDGIFGGDDDQRVPRIVDLWLGSWSMVDRWPKVALVGNGNVGKFRQN